MERGFLLQGGSIPSGPTESYEWGPTYNRLYPTSIEKQFPRHGSPTQLPRWRSYMTSTKRALSSKRSYFNISGPFSISQVLPNSHEEGHYRPGGHTSIYQVLPNLHEEGHYRLRGPTSIYQILS
ncbi:hypothetical protein Fot_12067 [Forsythia ovata]|uniref:Uncharacterized protein n=1 Tax=Forsythia ovata TaxID=205694 RepID=A0ABD1WLN4_9LAMI